MAVYAEACRQRISRFFTTPSPGADGHVSGTVDYDIFGEPVTETGVFAGSAGGSGGISALVFAYAGKPYDSVTGLSDYGFRDYAPTLARFTTVDPVRDGSNWYAYCNSDPVNYVDAWGLTASDSGGSSGQYAKWNKFVSDFDNSFYSIINGDFGLDQFANGARAWSNGDYGNAVLYGLSGVAEAALDMALVYTGAKEFGAFVGEVFSYVSSWFTSPEAGSINGQKSITQSMQTEYARVDNIMNIEKYGQNLGKNGQLFLTDAKTVEGFNLTTKTGLENAEQVLGLPKGQLSNSEINVITTVNTTGLNIRLPTSGNEFFIPGGVTSGGASEIVVDPMNIFTDPSVTSIQFIQKME